jgi:hypothetical protein
MDNYYDSDNEFVQCNQLPQNIPAYYDRLIIPEIFYNSVIKRNINDVNNIIKYHPKLSISVVSFYDLILKGSFFYKKSGKNGSSYKIKWSTKEKNYNIILNYNEQAELYKYITTSPWKYTNMGFLINAINNYLVQLRFVMGLINNKIPANDYYYLGVNVHNNLQMKIYISQFIPGIR